MATAAKINNADRAAVVRFAWGLAYFYAVRAAQPVRGHIGAGMREAWRQFRQARADGIVPEQFTEAYEEQVGRPGRVEARAYLKAEIARKAAEASAPATVDAVDEATAPEGQLCMLTWIVDDAIRAGEPGLYAVDQVEPVAPVPEMTPARPAPVEPKPVQLCIIDLIAADVAKAEEPAVVVIPETVPADQDDEDALDEVVIEQVVDPRQELLERIARNDAAMERIEQEVRRNVEIYGMSGGVDHMHDLLDGMHTHGLNLRDDLKELGHQPVPMMPPAQQPSSSNPIR
ncbi:hypothetical protein MKK64_05225 [Methylobacterium sp. E-025]|jgi:hypothetical protein|uniref:hypothetical protein n=1 Tax=Methylobacterium sp. E-025 TaxID=2836561 RepID=UPI001FB9CFB4|nr:hypothetical protein [Methylobacterium sp. E-025]MCJ2110606.1 hypothetical protein [Methylobacterium sp. E-025]